MVWRVEDLVLLFRGGLLHKPERIHVGNCEYLVLRLRCPIKEGAACTLICVSTVILDDGCLHLRRQSVAMQGRTLSSHTLEVYTLSRPLAAPLEVKEKGDTYAVSAYTAGLSTSRVRSSLLKEVGEKGDTYAVYTFTAGPSTSQVATSVLP
ncbi:hypothetical protein K469DRAFT_693889 [Zopfia rhizophila CBS 207.26]|uniref:Uncharacterized protein n=1 Tax=Zopfia rhizophila CBS 207.26 TaxID=1314779 RepID=A0A6A6DKK1_9PEZI|nr:hypothetical protein K469DRAFT_693889 [Zopfia rhizophila CBS 207.26]